MSGLDVNIGEGSDFFEVLGYLATPKRLVSIDAEVPESKASEFCAKYGDKFFIISDGLTPSGMPRKFGIQLRINFLSVNNAPTALTSYLKKGRGVGIVARINRSLFVEKLLSKFGFVLGTLQDVASIRATIPAQYITDFDRGFNR